MVLKVSKPVSAFWFGQLFTGDLWLQVFVATLAWVAATIAIRAF